MTAALDRRARPLGAVPLRPRAPAGAAAARAPQRGATAAGGAARRARLAARRGDHHRLVHRRRHDRRVDPAARAPRISARSTSSCSRATRPTTRGSAARLRDARRPDVDGVLPIVSLDAAAVSTASGELRSSPRSQVVAVDFGDARALRRRRARDRDERPDAAARPRGGHERSRAGAPSSRRRRDRRLRLRPRRRTCSSTACCRGAGSPASRLGEQQESRNVLVSPGDLRRDRGAVAVAAAGSPTRRRSYAVAVSNRGGVEGGVGR